MRRYVETYADAARAPEVWVMLGWKEHAAGNLGNAREAFERALELGDDRIKRAAKRGLDRTK
jgi:cytochrome c-type biogenesis protein CcmH/NrfG